MPTAGERFAAMEEKIAAQGREIGELKAETLRLWKTIEHMNEVKFPQTLADALRPIADLRSSMRFNITTLVCVFTAALGALIAVGLKVLG